MAENSACCPRCGQQGKKLSGVIAQNTSSEEAPFQRKAAVGSLSSSDAVIIRNTLAKDFAPPARPMPGCFLYGTHGMLFVLFIKGLAISYIFFILGVLSTPTETIFGGMPPLMFIIKGTFYVFIPAYVLTYLTYWRDRSPIAKWERAMPRWHMLYYCEHDDVLYNPQTSELFARNRKAMMAYIHSD